MTNSITFHIGWHHFSVSLNTGRDDCVQWMPEPDRTVYLWSASTFWWQNQLPTTVNKRLDISCGHTFSWKWNTSYSVLLVVWSNDSTESEKPTHDSLMTLFASTVCTWLYIEIRNWVHCWQTYHTASPSHTRTNLTLSFRMFIERTNTHSQTQSSYMYVKSLFFHLVNPFR